MEQAERQTDRQAGSGGFKSHVSQVRYGTSMVWYGTWIDRWIDRQIDRGGGMDG